MLKYIRQGPTLPSIMGVTVYERPVFELNAILQCQMLTVRMTDWPLKVPEQQFSISI